MISADTTIEELYNDGLISVRTMNVCHYGEIKTLSQLLKTERNKLLQFRNCGLKTILELDELRERFNNCLQNNPITLEETELINAKKKIELLPPISVVQLKGWIESTFNNLSVRAKNAFPQFRRLSSVIDTIYSSQKFKALDVKNVGKKTCREIQNFLENVESHFDELTKGIDPSIDSPKHNEHDRLVAKLGELFPFLLYKECEEVAEYMGKNKHIPILFIAKQYILRSDESRLNIYREYYGFNSEERRYNISEIGVKNKLSRERIRQLVNESIILPQNIEDEIRPYLTTIMDNIMPIDSISWEKIQHDNMLEESASQTALLICSLTDTHTIIQIDDTDKQYLVCKDLIKNVKIRNVASNIKRVCELRRTTFEQLDILEYIKHEKRIYHSNVVQLCKIYASFINRKLGLKIVDNRYVMMAPNTLDISAVIENILEQKGIPMSLDELLESFNSLYPLNAIDDSNKLKHYITRNQNIKPKGKSGMYLLRSWSNHFTGTITNYIEHILHTFNEPVLLDYLVEFILEEFPKTNKKSIYSLIAGDKEKRFIVYEQEYIGLINNTFPKLDLNEHLIIKRQNFETHFDNLKKFVNLRKRMPHLRGSEDEKSLARWISNVLKSNIDSTDEQISSLKEFLSNNISIPQNCIEYNFKQMCDRVKVIVTTSFSLPTISDNTTEYNWFRKNLEKYNSYCDNRKLYFTDLLSYIRDFGFYF